MSSVRAVLACSCTKRSRVTLVILAESARRNRRNMAIHYIAYRVVPAALMVFTSLHFVAFFAVVYAAYRVLPHRGQNWLLLIASYYFYAAWDWRFLSLLIGSTLVDYGVARAIAAATDPRRRRHLLWLSLAFNFGMLGFFKYFDFFAG